MREGSEWWAEKAKQEREDFQTKKMREDLKISLTDKQYNILKSRAYKAGFKSPAELVTSFVADFTGWHRNGSDEEDKADEWYNRAFGSSEYYSNFRYHLFNNDFCLDDMKDIIEDADWFEDVYQDYLAENSHMTNESKEECMEILKELVNNGVEL